MKYLKTYENKEELCTRAKVSKIVYETINRDILKKASEEFNLNIEGNTAQVVAKYEEGNGRKTSMNWYISDDRDTRMFSSFLEDKQPNITYEDIDITFFFVITKIDFTREEASVGQDKLVAEFGNVDTDFYNFYIRNKSDYDQAENIINICRDLKKNGYEIVLMKLYDENALPRHRNDEFGVFSVRVNVGKVYSEVIKKYKKI